MKQKFLILFFYFSYQLIYCQNNNGPSQITALLKDNSENQVLSRINAYEIIDKKNEKEAIELINLIQKKIANEPKEIITRFNALKSRILFYKLQEGDSLYAMQMKTALKEAYQYDNQYMIAEYSRWYGEMTNTLGNLQEAIQHYAYAIKVQEFLGIEHFPFFSSFCINLGEMLIHSSNTRESIYYFKKGFENKSKEKFKPEYLGFHLISMSMNYKKLKIHDSALLYCIQAMEIGRKNNLPEIEGLAQYYRFEPYLGLNNYDSCYAIIKTLEDASVENGVEITTAVVARMRGLIYFKNNNFQNAIPQFLTAIKYYIDINELKSIIDVYEGIYQSYFAIGDSVNGNIYKRTFEELTADKIKYKTQINAEFLLAKANFEKEQLSFKQLYKQKEKDIWIRNIGIVSLILLVLLIAYRFNKKRKETLIEKQNTETVLENLNKDYLHANDELSAVKQQLENKEVSQLKIEQIEKLKTTVILTNIDWLDFQKEFNLVFPGYINKLKEIKSDITEAELRMAVLIKIKLNSKQMALNTGVSEETIRKTKQRLRNRLALTDFDKLEEFLNQI